MNRNLETSVLGGILAENVVMHKFFEKDKRQLMDTVTTMFLSGNMLDREEISAMTEMQRLNYSTGNLYEVFHSFMLGVKEVIELSGYGARRASK